MFFWIFPASHTVALLLCGLVGIIISESLLLRRWLFVYINSVVLCSHTMWLRTRCSYGLLYVIWCDPGPLYCHFFRALSFLFLGLGLAPGTVVLLLYNILQYSNQRKIPTSPYHWCFVYTTVCINAFIPQTAALLWC